MSSLNYLPPRWTSRVPFLALLGLLGPRCALSSATSLGITLTLHCRETKVHSQMAVSIDSQRSQICEDVL